MKEVFVPVCENMAYFKGNIINTNECKLYLGEDYFVKTTNNRALKILSHRRSKIETLIDEINKEIKQYDIVNDLTTPKDQNLKKLSDETFEIVEEFNEKEEDKGTIKIKELQAEEKNKINYKLQSLLESRIHLQKEDLNLKEEESEELKPNFCLKKETLKKEYLNKDLKVVEDNTENKKKKDILHIESSNISSQKPEERRSLFYLEDEDD